MSLQELVAEQLGALSLRDDPDTVEFVVGLVEEESFESEDRRSAILGMLEAEEDDVTTADAVDKLLEETSIYQDKVLAARRAAEEAEAAAAAAAAEGRGGTQYGYLEEETEADRLAREEAERAPDKALQDPRQMSKKQRKKALEGVDLLALPNLNKAHVDAAEKQRRAASASAAQAKKARDEADRKKQKDDEKRKLEEKRKKAQKVERKA
ncbi:hypothetical protein RHOSPDRAFT_36558 [Rhodotorula sp. JG-1b]|nr:hypothetical protein RHOSPDRAFT_36558 [Rhodotorula sp. JG-1b]